MELTACATKVCSLSDSLTSLLPEVQSGAAGGKPSSRWFEPPRTSVWPKANSVHGNEAGLIQPRYTPLSLTLARQDDPEFGEIARRTLDINAAAMLLHNDVVAH